MVQKLLSECSAWLNWKVVALLGIVVLGGIWYAEGASWRLWLSASPLLAIMLCVLPCLIPLFWLRRKDTAN
jgi:hypothetical protein